MPLSASVLSAGCVAEDNLRGETPPASLIRLARRARQYYGLITEAAGRLGVGRHYVSGVLNLHRFNPSGRLGHWRVFECVAGLVVDYEAALSSLNSLFGISGGLMHRSGVVPPMTAAIFLCERDGPPVYTHTEAWADDKAELRRVLIRFRDARRARGGQRVIVCHNPDIAGWCSFGCAGHLAVTWHGDTTVVMWDGETGRRCMAALDVLLNNETSLADICVGAHLIDETVQAAGGYLYSQLVRVGAFDAA